MTEKRLTGCIVDEYHLVCKVMPHFNLLQSQVGDEIARLGRISPKVIDIGCGVGITTHNILSARPDAVVTALDNEQKMISRARKNLKAEMKLGKCKVVYSDALTYIRKLPLRSVDVVASALTIHNMKSVYRNRLHKQIHRVLKPGGIFVNADKYAPQNDSARFVALGITLERFFKTFQPLKKYQLLHEWVLHNVADQGPDRVMKKDDAIKELRSIGFKNIRVGYRNNMEAVLVAKK